MSERRHRISKATSDRLLALYRERARIDTAIREREQTVLDEAGLKGRVVGVDDHDGWKHELLYVPAEETPT